MAFKNAIALLLLLVFTFNLGGSYLILKLQRHHIRKEIFQQIKAGIFKNELTSIIISSETEHQLIWEDNEEFSYKGMMYDVVRIEILDSKTKVYHCISDVKETKLIATYNKKLKKNRKNKNRTNPVETIKFLQKINPLPPKDKVVFLQKVRQTNFGYNNNYTPLSLEISSPPPKQVL